MKLIWIKLNCSKSFALCILIFYVFLFDVKVYAQRQDTVRVLREVKILSKSIPIVNSISPVQQINSSDFKKISAYNLADAIRNFSGVNIKDYGGIGGLKTVSVRSLGANHTGVQLDGLAIGDSQNGQVDLGKINLDNIESISLFNGQPSDITVSARSLASASLLVVNSSEPKFQHNKKYNFEAQFKTGSFGLINPSLQWQQQLNKNWALNFTNIYQKANGKYKYKVDGDGSDTLALRTNADIEVFQTDANLIFKPNDSTSFNIRANYYQSDRGLPGAVVFYNPYTNQHLWNKDFFLQIRFKKKWNKLQYITAFKYANNYLRYLDPDYLNIAGELNQEYKQQELYGSTTIVYSILKYLDFAYAGDFIYNTLSTNLYNYAYPNRYSFLNAFSGRFKSNSIEIQASLLHTYIHENVAVGKASDDKTIYSPSILASFKPWQNRGFMIRAFYKEIFRNPTFNDLYYTRMGNRALKPEFASQYNLGLSYSKAQLGHLNYLTFTADAYYNNVKDKIIAIPNKDLFSWTMLNLGEVDIRGIDIGLKTQVKVLNDLDFSISGNYTYQQALDVTDKTSSVYLNQIPYTPEHTFAINIGFDINDWSLFYNQIYSSHRYYLSENLPEYFVPGFNVGDLSISKNFSVLQKSVSVSTEINNLFNQSYAFIRSFPMPGRSIRISCKIQI
jgi:vitamin B12 transporter